jgi:hypothetical protein
MHGWHRDGFPDFVTFVASPLRAGITWPIFDLSVNILKNVDDWRAVDAAGGAGMDSVELRALQAPIKERYKSDPSAACNTLKANGSLQDDGIACKVESGRALAVAGCIRRPAAPGLSCIPAICCSRRLSPAAV